MLVNESLSKSQICKKLGYLQISGSLKKSLKEMLDEGIIKYTLEEKSKSSLQKYKLTSCTITEIIRSLQNKTDESSDPQTIQDKIINLLSNEPLSKSQIAQKLGYAQISGTMKKTLKEMLEHKIISYTNIENPNSRLQKYKLLNNKKN